MLLPTASFIELQKAFRILSDWMIQEKLFILQLLFYRFLYDAKYSIQEGFLMSFNCSVYRYHYLPFLAFFSL
jgi:hypothetical protein